MTLLQTAALIANSLHIAAPSHDFGAGVDWATLLRHADGHSLTPLLYATWRDAGLLDRIPQQPHARLEASYRDNARRNENIRRELLEVSNILSGAGAPHLVLKGWPLVERLYADAATRVLYDHDFLLSPPAAAASHRALREAGFSLRPEKDEWVQKHLPPLWRNNGYQWDGYLYDPDYPRPVELHVRLWEDNWRGLRIRALPDPWATAVTRTVAGEPLQTLSDEDAVIHLAMHFAEHLVQRETRLNQLLDLARFVTTVAGLDWDLIQERAAAAGVSRFVYASLWLAREIFGSARPPSGVWGKFAAKTPPAFRDWLARHGAADALTADFRRPTVGMDYRLTWLAAGSGAEKFGILRFAALPPLAQLMSKYHVRHRALGLLLYPRHFAQRAWVYGRGLLRT